MSRLTQVQSPVQPSKADVFIMRNPERCAYAKKKEKQKRETDKKKRRTPGDANECLAAMHVITWPKPDDKEKPRMIQRQ
jgi:hypothetical protein